MPERVIASGEPRDGRVLGLDVGAKTVGLAVSDPLGVTAQPLRTLYRSEAAEKDLAAIADLVSSLHVGEVVVGLPTRTDGSDGPEAQRVRRFVRRLEEHLRPVPVRLVDERFSTRQAERVLLEADLSRSRRRKTVNHVAAAIILDAYLAARRRVRGEGDGDPTTV